MAGTDGKHPSLGVDFPDVKYCAAPLLRTRIGELSSEPAANRLAVKAAIADGCRSPKFQYSNLMAAAAGYTAAYVVYPQMELGACYDRGMQSYVFDPLQMRATTFNFATALAGNHATAHAPDIDGKPAKALMAVNNAVIPVRPALEQRT